MRLPGRRGRVPEYGRVYLVSDEPGSESGDLPMRVRGRHYALRLDVLSQHRQLLRQHVLHERQVLRHHMLSFRIHVLR